MSKSVGTRRNAGGEPAAVYAVCGAEAFLKRRALMSIADRVLGQADRTMALCEYDGSDASVELAVVLDDLRTLPFLAERRLVIVREADAFITRYRSQLEAYVEQPASTGVLVLECKSLPGNTRLAKRIHAAGEVIACDALKSREISGWLANHAKQDYGLRLDGGAANRLVDLVGTDLGLLDGELQKLALYVGERKRVSTEDVAALVGQVREEQIWGVLSAVAEGDAARAMTLWEEVWLTDRAASARSIGGLAYKVRQLLNAKHAERAGASMFDLGKILLVFRDPARVKAELSAFSTDELELMHCRLLDADVKSKTGRATVRSSIESLILEMCGRRGRRRVSA